MARRKPTPEEAAATRQANLEKLSTRLEQAVEKLTTGEDWARALAFAARFRSRSFNNTMLILEQHAAAYAEGRTTEPSATYVAGYVDWTKLGRHPIAGGSYLIYSPVFARYASANPADPGSWRHLDRREKPQPGEVVRRKMVDVKPAHVWDVSQTTGEPIPERPMPRLLEGQAPEGLWDGLAQQLAKAGFSVSGVPDATEIEGANGMTDYLARTVQVRADMDDAAQVKTLAHELAHVLMHDRSSQARPVHEGIGEVEAESVALMVGAAYGMDTSQYTVPYVASWSAEVAEQDPIMVIRATGERVRKTAAAILDQLPAPASGDGYPPGLDHDPSERPAELEAPRSQRRGAREPVGALADRANLAASAAAGQIATR